MDDYKDYPSHSSYGESAGAAAGAATAKIVDRAADIKEKVTDLGRKAAEKVDQSRQSAASALDSTASSLHSTGDKVSGAAHSAADSVQATADYVRRTGIRGMGEDIQDMVSRYPGISLTVAAVLGFLVARSLSSSD